MDWLWIPAVSLIGMLCLLLCWLFFQDYKCCPCRRVRPTDLLPTYFDEAVSPISQSSTVLPTVHPARPARPPVPTKPPSLARQYTLTASGSPNLHLRHGVIPIAEVMKWQNGIPCVDLHNMTVFEARDVAMRFVWQSRGRYKKVGVVTGRGVHSRDGVAKLKPTIEKCLMDSNFTYREINNGGCLEVQL